MNDQPPSGKAPISYHGRVLLYVVLLLLLPATVVDYLSNPHITVWTFAPGVLAAVAILGYLYLKWWREGRLG